METLSKYGLSYYAFEHQKIVKPQLSVSKLDYNVV
jgi:hypothetical protein